MDPNINTFRRQFATLPPRPLQRLQKGAKMNQNGVPETPPGTPKGSKMDQNKAPETPPET